MSRKFYKYIDGRLEINLRCLSALEKKAVFNLLEGRLVEFNDKGHIHPKVKGRIDRTIDNFLCFDTGGRRPNRDRVITLLEEEITVYDVNGELLRGLDYLDEYIERMSSYVNHFTLKNLKRYGGYEERITFEDMIRDLL